MHDKIIEVYLKLFTYIFFPRLGINNFFFPNEPFQYKTVLRRPCKWNEEMYYFLGGR